MQWNNTLTQFKIHSGCLQSPLRVRNQENDYSVSQDDVGVGVFTDVGFKPCQATWSYSEGYMHKRSVRNVVAERGIMDRRMAIFPDVEKVSSDMFTPNAHMSQKSARCAQAEPVLKIIV